MDANHAQIVKDLRKAGAEVESLAGIGLGVPDLLVSYRGVNYLLEVKREDGTLRVSQIEWMKRWRGQVDVVRSSQEALEAIGAVKRKGVA